MNPKDLLKKAAEWATLVAILGTVGVLWINTEVERRMKELAKDPGTHPSVVENRSKLQSLEAGQQRIENKVDAFSSQFLAYLERQAGSDSE